VPGNLHLQIDVPQVDEPRTLIHIQTATVAAPVKVKDDVDNRAQAAGDSQQTSFVIIGGNERGLFDVVESDDNDNTGLDGTASAGADRRSASRGAKTGK
jgi:hypothetical protein